MASHSRFRLELSCVRPEAGIDIPKLCATDNLEAFGSCRLCLVEIDGRSPGTPASCTTLVAEGMSSHADAAGGETVRNVMELYISDHPLDWLDLQREW